MLCVPSKQLSGVVCELVAGTRRFEDQVKDGDLVLEPVGRETQAASWAVLRAGGVLVSIVVPPDQEAAAALEARRVSM